MRYATLLSLLFLTVLFFACEKPFWADNPKADIQIYGGYWYQDGSIACCYDYTLDASMSENMYRLKWEYLCDDGKVAIKTHERDKIWWMTPGARWVKLTVWNNDGESDSEIKYFNVK